MSRGLKFLHVLLASQGYHWVDTGRAESRDDCSNNRRAQQTQCSNNKRGQRSATHRGEHVRENILCDRDKDESSHKANANQSQRVPENQKDDLWALCS